MHTACHATAAYSAPPVVYDAVTLHALQDLSGFESVEEALAAAQRANSQTGATSSSPRTSLPQAKASESSTSSSSHGSPTVRAKITTGSDSPKAGEPEGHEALRQVLQPAATWGDPSHTVLPRLSVVLMQPLCAGCKPCWVCNMPTQHAYCLMSHLQAASSSLQACRWQAQRRPSP